MLLNIPVLILVDDDDNASDFLPLQIKEDLCSSRSHVIGVLE